MVARIGIAISPSNGLPAISSRTSRIIPWTAPSAANRTVSLWSAIMGMDAAFRRLWGLVLQPAQRDPPAIGGRLHGIGPPGGDRDFQVEVGESVAHHARHRGEAG